VAAAADQAAAATATKSSGFNSIFYPQKATSYRGLLVLRV